jgi:adenylate cyclase class 2
MNRTFRLRRVFPDMYEVEVKVRAEHGPVRDRLAALDAVFVDAVVQTDTYYDAPDRSFAETDEALRIRRERPRDGGETETAITYKGPKVDDTSKTREEHQTGVTDPAAAEGVLEGLGYEAAATVRKERERFAVGEPTVTLDDVDGLGTFVEVELDVEAESAVPEARERAFEVLEALGLDPDAGIRTSYLGLRLGATE